MTSKGLCDRMFIVLKIKIKICLEFEQSRKAKQIMIEHFGKTIMIALATMENGTPSNSSNLGDKKGGFLDDR